MRVCVQGVCVWKRRCEREGGHNNTVAAAAAARESVNWQATARNCLATTPTSPMHNTISSAPTRHVVCTHTIR